MRVIDQVCKSSHTLTHMHMQTHTHAYTHTHIHTRTHIHADTHARICTLLTTLTGVWGETFTHWIPLILHGNHATRAEQIAPKYYKEILNVDQTSASMTLQGKFR